MAVLAEVGKHLDSIDSLLVSVPFNNTGARGDIFSSDERQAIGSILTQVRVEIHAIITGSCGNWPDSEPMQRWRVRTHLEFAEVEIQEISAAKLRGYGSLDVRAFSEMEQAIKNLRNHLGELRTIL